MQKLRLKFVDFWFGFSPESSYFYALLSKSFKVELSDDPDILIYSCYGREHLRYNCIRVFYTAENRRSDFSGCDFALTFDYNSNPRHYRLPLYAIYLHHNPGSLVNLGRAKTPEEALAAWRNKKKFCCMIVSNPAASKRIEFFRKLNAYKQVDSAGRVLNNTGYLVENKLAFIKDYRFVFAFENESYPGYTTEKIIEPFMMQSIPLYWGDPLVCKDFNEDAFLHYKTMMTDEQFIEHIREIDMNEEKAVKMLMQPVFTNTAAPDFVKDENLINFFNKIVTEQKKMVPVAKTWRGCVYQWKITCSYYKSRISNQLVRVVSKLGLQRS